MSNKVNTLLFRAISVSCGLNDGTINPVVLENYSYKEYLKIFDTSEEGKAFYFKGMATVRIDDAPELKTDLDCLSHYTGAFRPYFILVVEFDGDLRHGEDDPHYYELRNVIAYRYNEDGIAIPVEIIYDDLDTSFIKQELNYCIGEAIKTQKEKLEYSFPKSPLPSFHLLPESKYKHNNITLDNENPNNILSVFADRAVVRQWFIKDGYTKFCITYSAHIKTNVFTAEYVDFVLTRSPVHQIVDINVKEHALDTKADSFLSFSDSVQLELKGYSRYISLKEKKYLKQVVTDNIKSYHKRLFG